jgi:hypothetical protein
MDTCRLLPDDHPYVRCLTVDVYEQRGKWIVDYRDFATVRQDIECETQEAAYTLAKKILCDPHIIWDGEQGLPYEYLTKYWTDELADRSLK